MSRSYAIRVPVEVLLSENLRESLAGFKLQFPLLEILPAEQMQQLVREKLLAAGFLDTPDGLVMPVAEGQSAVFNLAAMEMTLSINVVAAQEIRVYEESLNWINGNIRDALENGRVIADTLGIDLPQRLARKKTDLAIKARSEVNAALKDVYRESIKAKAATIGSVTDVSESSEGNVYRIRVEISQ